MIGPAEYKRALRKFTSGITIVTADNDGEPHGMTATAFASVSLQPPLILVCLDKASQTRRAVLDGGLFAVNVLSSDQQWISRAFARRGDKPFARLDHRTGSSGAPLIEGAIAWMECRVTEVVGAGDHDVVIAEVIDAAQADGAPLVYFDRRYRSLREDGSS